MRKSRSTLTKPFLPWKGKGNTRLPYQNTKVRRSVVSSQAVEKTRNMLKLVHECRDAGVNTLHTLYEQGEQLKRTDETLDVTDALLDDAGQTLKHIKRTEEQPVCCSLCVCCIHRSKRKHDKVKSKEQIRVHTSDDNDALKGIIPISYVYDEPQNFSETTNEKGTIKIKTKMSTSDASEFPKPQPRAEEFYHNIHHVSEHLSKLKNIAANMTTEVDSHNAQVDKLNFKVEKTHGKVIAATNTTRDLVIGKKETSSSKRCCVIL